MKNEGKKISVSKKIGGYLMTMAMGLFAGFMTLGIGFAASPTMAEATMESQYDNVWEAVEDQAEEEDLAILSEYMDNDKLIAARENANSICEILQKYCEYDVAFYDIVCDYFC